MSDVTTETPKTETATITATNLNICMEVPKPGFWGAFKNWLIDVNHKIWDAFCPFLKTQAASFISQAKPIIIDAIKKANELPDTTSNEDKHKFAKDLIITNLKATGMTYKDSFIDTGIMIMVQVLKEQLSKTTTK